MIAKSMMDGLRKLAHAEKARAQKQYGQTYASMHEGVGVLAEEVQEAGDSLADMVTALDTLIRVHRRGEDTGDGLREIYRYALLTAAECVQVAAVCLKAAKGGAEHAG